MTLGFIWTNKAFQLIFQKLIEGPLPLLLFEVIDAAAIACERFARLPHGLVLGGSCGHSLVEFAVRTIKTMIANLEIDHPSFHPDAGPFSFSGVLYHGLASPIGPEG
ncbi:MAG: hypothetical protein WBV23_07700, partial [Desulfobaccales bacterium]